MKLSELLYRAAGLRAAEDRRAGAIDRLKEVFRMGKSTKGLVAIPNKIRKRFGNAAR